MNLLLASLCFTLAPAGAPLADDLPPFGDFGKELLKDHLHAANVADVPPEKLLTQHCVHESLGMFEVAFPIWSLADKAQFENLRLVSTALLEVQGRWVDWLAKGEPAGAPLKADVDTLTAWVKAWKPAGLAKADTAPDKDLFVLLGANEAQLAAAKHLREALCKVETLGVGPKDGAPLSMLFAPGRHDMIQLLGYAGLSDPAQQPALWCKDATQWTTFWIGWNLVLALEYAPWGDDKTYKSGLSMNKFEPTGMLEHTVQQSMLALLWKCYGDSDALYVNQAQALNMAIEVCGSCNALEGDGGRGSTGAKTDAYEKFVPGGNPNGGILPPMPAGGLDGIKKIPWREGAGKDHFAIALRKGQKNAQKQMTKEKPPGLDASLLKDKDAHFLLLSADVATKYVISAPFFGKYAKEKVYPPASVIADYKEFFRSYKCAFCYWLQTQGDKGGAEPSAKKYEQLLKTLATRDPAKSLEDLAKEIYGVQLSDKNGDADSLEWRFLEWLGKGK